MAQENINIGSSANDGTGDALRVAFQKCEANFTELYTLVASLSSAVQDTIIDVFNEQEYFTGAVKRTFTLFKSGLFAVKLRWEVKADTSQYVVNMFPELSAGVIVNHNFTDALVEKASGSFSYGTYTINKFYSNTAIKSSSESQQGNDVAEGWSEDLGIDEPASYYKEDGSSMIDLSTGAVNWTWDNSASAVVSGTIREIVITGHILGGVLA